MATRRNAKYPKGRNSMYTENNFLTPRERINEDLLRRVLSDTSAVCANSEERSYIKNDEQNISTHRKSWGLEGHPLASVYAPLQEWRNVYDTELGFSRGTIFKELDLPFLCGEKSGGGCCGR